MYRQWDLWSFFFMQCTCQYVGNDMIQRFHCLQRDTKIQQLGIPCGGLEHQTVIKYAFQTHSSFFSGISAV